MSLQEGICQEECISRHLQLLLLWDLPLHLHGSHTLFGMFPAKGWAYGGYESWGIPAQNGVTLWVVFAPGLPIRLLETFSVQHCSLKPFLPNPPSPFFSSYKCQTHITVWRLSLPTPASSLLDPSQTFP